MDIAQLGDYSLQVDFSFGPKDNLGLMMRSHCRFLAAVSMIWFLFIYLFTIWFTFKTKVVNWVRVQSGDQNHKSYLNRENWILHKNY